MSSKLSRKRIFTTAGVAAVVVVLGAVTYNASASVRGYPGGWPSGSPSGYPSDYPSDFPSDYPSDYPSDEPSEFPSDDPSADPSEGTPDYDDGPVVTDPILLGRRQIAIRPFPSARASVTIERNGRVSLTNSDLSSGRFVLTRIQEGKFQIRSAKAAADGRSVCLVFKQSGNAKPNTIATAPCDVSQDGQRWFISQQTVKDQQGRATFRISNRGGQSWVVNKNNELIAAEPQRPAQPTDFSFVDSGPAPALG